MSLTATEIAAVVAELAPLAGGRVEGVRVHAERALSIDVRGPGGRTTLVVSAEPDLTRIHAAERRPGRALRAGPFEAALRREIEGARLAGIEASPGDRVVALRLERGEARWALIAELTGRHGNIFLVGEGGRVRASAGRSLSRRRNLVPGEPYQPPAAREPEAPAAPRLEPVPGARFPLSAAVEAHYLLLEERRALAEGRQRLRRPVRAALARARRALERLAEEAARVPAAEADRRAGDLIKANLHLLTRGQPEALLADHGAGEPRQVRVALDPALTALENMERYYRRYRRIAESGALVAERAHRVREREAALLALLGEIDGAGVEALPRLEREARRLGAAPPPPPAPRRRREEPAPPYRRFRSAIGAAILVGRGAAENDRLTLSLARGNDLWLHARGRAGAHVVLRLERGKGPDQESLLDAAHLAAHFSDGRGEVGPEVAYTRAKHVRKPRGAAPGAVTYSQERTLALRFEPGRMERLLASEESPQAEPASRRQRRRSRP